MNTPDQTLPPLNWKKATLLGLGAAGCFHAAYTPAQPGLLGFLIIGYVVCLVQLARLRTTRQSFYTGLLVGLACFGPQLGFFWTIFGPAAIALWTVLAVWIALFVALTHVALVRLGVKRAVWLVPFLWTGLEYFRSELYYLKFSWMSIGLGLPANQIIFPIWLLGSYGVGILTALLASLSLKLKFTRFNLQTFCNIFFPLLIPVIIGSLLTIANSIPVAGEYLIQRNRLILAGIQMEFPNQSQILEALDRLNIQPVNTLLKGPSPEAWERVGATNVDLIVLSEYTLDEPPSQKLKDWCRVNQKFLIVGGKDPAPGGNFYNTAFVISTNGEVVFKQVKSVPIQFFKDGLPAPEQKLWNSPWGKIGICICYDLCYSRVTDELVRQGAQMIIAPTMDVADWGAHQHELHARIAPVRAAEYGIPIFRLASSGISQGVTRSGYVQASAPFPGEGEMIFFATRLGRPGSLPLDRWLAPFCVGVTAVFIGWVTMGSLRRKTSNPPEPPQCA